MRPPHGTWARVLCGLSRRSAKLAALVACLCTVGCETYDFGIDVGTPVLHRVIQRGVLNGRLELVTKGDNALVDPMPIPEDAVRGKLISRIPYAGLALGLLPITALAILAIAAPVALGRYLLKRASLPA